MLSTVPSAGVDVGQQYLDLGFFPASKPVRVDNSADGISRIVALLRERGVVKIAIEAIGPYARDLVCALVEAGFSTFVVNPRRIKAFRDAEGRIAKTDSLDAGLIARFIHLMSQDLRPLTDVKQLTLKALSTRRRQLTELVAMERTRLRQAADALVTASCRDVITLLNGKCAEIEAEMDRLIEAETALSDRRKILLSVPGFGPRISALVVVEMPELGAIDRKAAASLAGLAPHPSQSGVSKGRNEISGGRPCLRSAFYMAALVAMRTHPKVKALYKKMRDEGKPAKVALVAIARRLVIIANALLREKLTFDKSKFAA